MSPLQASPATLLSTFACFHALGLRSQFTHDCCRTLAESLVSCRFDVNQTSMHCMNASGQQATQMLDSLNAYKWQGGLRLQSRGVQMWQVYSEPRQLLRGARAGGTPKDQEHVLSLPPLSYRFAGAVQSHDSGGQGSDSGGQEQVEAAGAAETAAPAHRLRRPRQPAHRQLQVRPLLLARSNSVLSPLSTVGSRQESDPCLHARHQAMTGAKSA